MNKYISNLIKQGEHQQLDFKYEVSDSQKLARTLAAFSNTDGGKLLIGVKDNGIIKGIRSDEELYMIESAAHIFTRPKIQYESKTWNIEGKVILEVSIPKGNKGPYYAKNEEGRWRVYIRVNDENFLANRVLLEVWKRKARKKGTYLKLGPTERKLLGYLKDNEQITLSEFCKLCAVPKRKAEQILINLIAIDAIEMNFTTANVYYQFKQITE